MKHTTTAAAAAEAADTVFVVVRYGWTDGRGRRMNGWYHSILPYDVRTYDVRGEAAALYVRTSSANCILIVHVARGN